VIIKLYNHIREYSKEGTEATNLQEKGSIFVDS